MVKLNFVNSNNPAVMLSAIMRVPEGFDQKWRYPAIVVSHPGGGVKEQTAGTYADKLAQHGFITIAYDASYQGESTGEPRQLENPHIRAEDISAVIDHLATQPFVDPNRIGAMGICAGAGYTANAAINDPRIKAVGTVSAVNIGAMFRNGWDNSMSSADAAPALAAGAAARTSDAFGKPVATIPLAPLTEADAANEELRQAWEYYHTPRAQYPTAPGVATARSLTQIIPYDAYHMADLYLTQPLHVVVGSEAGSKWMSEDLIERAASSDKKMHIVEGANHMDLYDRDAYVTEAADVLGRFFVSRLAPGAQHRTAAVA